MSNIRLFYSESLYINLKSKLDKTQSHYIYKVMRIKEGQNFSLFNQSGEFEAKVENILRGIVEFTIKKKIKISRQPKRNLACLHTYKTKLFKFNDTKMY